jgi:hypothetical protein
MELSVGLELKWFIYASALMSPALSVLLAD